jgi:hypothetical protein
LAKAHSPASLPILKARLDPVGVNHYLPPLEPFLPQSGVIFGGLFRSAVCGGCRLTAPVLTAYGIVYAQSHSDRFRCLPDAFWLRG